MPLCPCNFYAHSLGNPVNVMVFIPFPSRGASAGKSLDEIYPARQAFRTLYLLHGMYGDENSWITGTNIMRYAQEKNLAVVMPRAENSYYTDMLHGGAYFTFLTEELPRAMRALFPLSDRREDTFIAGLSMGGYGACKAALTKPLNYAAAASLSGAVDIAAVAGFIKTHAEREMFQNVFGAPECFAGSNSDLFQLTENLALQGAHVPRIYLACGVDDALCYPMNVHLCEHLRETGLPFTWEEGPGAHEWDFWDAYIRRVLDWL